MQYRKNHVLRFAIPGLVVLCLDPSMLLAGRRQVPLEELIRGSTVIVTGRTVAQERRLVADGVFEVAQHVAADEVLKGEPATVELTTLMTVENKGPVPVQSKIDAKDIVKDEVRTAKAVRIRFLDGPNVPSGKVTYELGERGVWFLPPGGDGRQPGVYHAADRRDATTLDEVRAKLRDAPATAPATRPATRHAGGGGTCPCLNMRGRDQSGVDPYWSSARRQMAVHSARSIS